MPVDLREQRRIARVPRRAEEAARWHIVRELDEPRRHALRVRLARRHAAGRPRRTKRRDPGLLPATSAAERALSAIAIEWPCPVGARPQRLGDAVDAQRRLHSRRHRAPLRLSGAPTENNGASAVVLGGAHRGPLAAPIPRVADDAVSRGGAPVAKRRVPGAVNVFAYGSSPSGDDAALVEQPRDATLEQPALLLEHPARPLIDHDEHDELGLRPQFGGRRRGAVMARKPRAAQSILRARVSRSRLYTCHRMESHQLARIRIPGSRSTCGGMRGYRTRCTRASASLSSGPWESHPPRPNCKNGITPR